MTNGYVAYFTFSTSDTAALTNASCVALSVIGNTDTVIVSQTNTQVMANLASGADNNGTRNNTIRLDFSSTASIPSTMCINSSAANYLLYATGLGSDY